MSKQVIPIGSHPDESNPDPEDSILTLTQPYRTHLRSLLWSKIGKKCRTQVV